MPSGWVPQMVRGSDGGSSGAAVARKWRSGPLVVVIVVAEITAFAVRAEVKVFAVVAFVAQ